MVTAVIYVIAMLFTLAIASTLGWWISQSKNISILFSTPTPQPLTDQLIFPEGWTPVDCGDGGNRGSTDYNDCHWVCVKEAVYRYCTPVIQPASTDDDAARGH